MSNPYAVLGLPNRAPLTDVQAAYRKLARQYHPDVNHTADAEKKIRDINAAWDQLKTPQSKAAIDQSLSDDAPRTFTGGRRTRSDIFDKAFSDFLVGYLRRARMDELRQIILNAATELEILVEEEAHARRP